MIVAVSISATFVAWGNIAASIRDYGKLHNDVLATFIAAIDNVVGMKANRFAKLADELCTDAQHRTAGNIFKTITEPELQINALLQATYEIFRNLWPGVNFEVSLIRVIENNHLESPFVKFLPEDRDPNITVEELESDRYSAASTALREKIVIVSDFQKELKKKKDRHYTASADHLDDEGSMLAFRVDHRRLGKGIYILSVCADKKHCITEEHKTTYQWIMREVEKRIALEYSLLLLKKHA
ncbi:hypothetical protein LLG46_00515 [bacterium]|nr:hypothetical protein [bacterium]